MLTHITHLLKNSITRPSNLLFFCFVFLFLLFTGGSNPLWQLSKLLLGLKNIILSFRLPVTTHYIFGKFFGNFPLFLTTFPSGINPHYCPRSEAPIPPDGRHQMPDGLPDWSNLLPSIPYVPFLPEITLAVMITYLLAAMAKELSLNRAPKTLAIECWRAACCALSFISLLYFIQLFDHTYSGPAVSDYLYISWGLTASKLLVTLSSLFVLHLSGGYIREHTRHILEFSIVILIGVLLLLILVSANNLMLLFLCLAGFSLNLYILVLYDGADAASREASLKYFYLSTLSAGLILFGVLLIYTTIGDVAYHTIRFYMDSPIDGHVRTVLSSGVLFILLGFFFKLSAFPGHLWAVEVYEGSPLPVMAFFILPVKVAVFITFLRLLNTVFLDFSYIWLPCVTLSALGSLIWGALAATQSRKTTRFLGYASINQIGFLLLGLVVDTDEGLRASFYYLVLYAIMTGGFLLVFTHLRKKAGSTLTAISDFRGLGKTEHMVCWNLSIFLFSMAGIPPLAGFLGKYYLLMSVMSRGLFIPVIVALAVSLITCYYYLRIIKTFWFEEDIAAKPPELLLSSKQRWMLSALEASLWAGAFFAPQILPPLTEVVATLTVCGDVSLLHTLFPSFTFQNSGLFCFLSSG